MSSADNFKKNSFTDPTTAATPSPARRLSKTLAGRSAAPPPREEPPLTAARLARLGEGWMLDGEVSLQSRRTHSARRSVLSKLLWFLGQEKFARCGPDELRAFLAHIGSGHLAPEGRWGDLRHVAASRPVRPTTVRTYYAHLSSLFNWAVAQGELRESPLARLRPPSLRRSQVRPFTPEQVRAMLDACRRSPMAARDEAIVSVLLDTGLRCSELTALTVGDVDLILMRAVVRKGKGNKSRVVPFGKAARRALLAYTKTIRRQGGEAAEVADCDPDTPLWQSRTSHVTGDPLTNSGLVQIIRRIGREAGVEGARCSPHTFRHTCAISFLRSGGDVFALKELLGHTSLAMTQVYVAYAQADISAKHRLHSPLDNLRRK